MRTIRILRDCQGYPNGQDRVDYVEGQEPTLSNEFAEIMVNAGHARYVDDAPAPTATSSKKKGGDTNAA